MLIDEMNAGGTKTYDEELATLHTLWRDAPARSARLVAELQRRGEWSEADAQALARRPPAKGEAHGYYTDFQNEYLDDSGWWAIAWLKMYARTHEPKYLAMARTIQAHMARNWNAEQGGIAWCEEPDKQRLNAITNTLFIMLSARLQSATGEPAYGRWALKDLAWFDANRLYDGTAVVDTLGHQGDYWSYNQGTYLGALIALAEATGDSQYLERAQAAAETILHRSGLVLPSGVLVEKIGTGGDAALFKGVLARYLAQLRDTLVAHRIHPEMASEIQQDLEASATSLLAQPVADDGLFPAEWQKSDQHGHGNFDTEVAGLMLLTTLLPKAATP
jgi:predicted alpha-1,6-mannanase (GH76 family)